ncbi:MAG: hypothetical protein C0594_10675, partial [Marinilabiliales bacterium]
MNLKNKNIEEIVRESLEGYELPYDPADWDRLENDLPSSGNKTSGKWMNWGIPSFVVVVALIGTWILSENANNSTTERSLSSESNAVSANQLENTISEIVQEEASVEHAS